MPRMRIACCGPPVVPPDELGDEMQLDDSRRTQHDDSTSSLGVQAAASRSLRVLSDAGDSEEEIASHVKGYTRAARYVTTEKNLLFALQKDPPNTADLGKWAEALWAMSLHAKTTITFFHILFCFEVGRTPDSLRTGGTEERSKTFLRTTSFLSKTLDCLTQKILVPLIRHVTGPMIKRILDDPKFLESDLNIDAAAKAGRCATAGAEEGCEGEDAEVPEDPSVKPALLQLELIELFLDGFESSMDDAPYVARMLCSNIMRVAKETGGDGVQMVSAFLLLRCFTPSLVLPERYGLLEDLGITNVSAFAAQKTRLMHVSRILQKFVNGRGFDETCEGYKVLNAAFADKFARFCSLLRRFSFDGEGDASAWDGVDHWHTPQQMIERCHDMHLLLHHNFSSLHRCLSHRSPLTDNQHIPQHVLRLLPHPPRSLVFRLAPPPPRNASAASAPMANGAGLSPLSFASAASNTFSSSNKSFGGISSNTQAASDGDLQYEQNLLEAHRPLGEVDSKMQVVSNMRCLRVSGMTHDRTTIVQIYPHRLPLSDPSPTTLHALMLHFIKLMDGISRSGYIIAVMVHPNNAARGTCMWLKRMYETSLPRRYSDNLRRLFILNPCLWVKGMVGVWGPLVGSRGILSKLQCGHSLPAMLEELKADPKKFPVSRCLMRDCGGVPSQPVIGHSIDDVMKRPEQRDRDYPSLPYQCINWLSAHGLGCKRLFEGHTDLNECSLGGVEDVGVAGAAGWCSLLMQYLRCVPGGVLRPQIMELCSAGADLCLPEDGTPNKLPAIHRIKQALSLLPPHHLCLTQDLFVLLHQMFLHSADSLLSPSALARIMAPVIFAECQPATLRATSSTTSIPPRTESPTQGEVTLTQFLIAQPPQFWRDIWTDRRRQVFAKPTDVAVAAALALAGVSSPEHDSVAEASAAMTE